MKVSIAVWLLLYTMAIGCRHGAEKNSEPVVAVKVARSRLADVPLTVEGPATIFGKAQANISARITTPIRRLGVHKGDNVKAGQVLAVLDSRDLEAQEADASAVLTDAKASLQKTQNGTLPADIQRAQSDLLAKQAVLTLTQKIYDRRRGLYQQGAISARELQVSEADRAQAKANYDVARMALDVLEHHTSTNDLQIAKGDLMQAEAKLKLAQANLDFSRLISPMNGTVTEQFMYPGDMAKPDMPLFTIVDLSTAVARAQVEASAAGSIRRGQACSFSASGLSGRTRKGVITVINQAVDPERGSVEVWCEIPNRDRMLKANLFGSVAIDVSVAHDAVIVPGAAVEFVEGTTQAKLYVVDAQRRAHLREVTAASMADGDVRVLSGLSAGQPVIVEGEYGLPDGAKVSVQETGK